MTAVDKQQPPLKTEQRIPVRALYLNAKRMLPNGQVSDVVLGGDVQANKARFVIEYIPATQHHRVAYFGPSTNTPTKVMMFPREWCSWEPA